MVCLVNAAEIGLLASSEIRPSRVLEQLYQQTWQQYAPAGMTSEPDFPEAFRQLSDEPFWHFRCSSGSSVEELPEKMTFSNLMEYRVSAVLDEELWRLLQNEDGRRRCWKVLTAVWL